MIYNSWYAIKPNQTKSQKNWNTKGSKFKLQESIMTIKKVKYDQKVIRYIKYQRMEYHLMKD